MAGDCAPRRDSGFFMVGWLTKIAVTFAIVGVLGFDGISLALGHVRIQDAAGQAATAASSAYGAKQDVAAATAAAQKAALENDATLAALQFAGGNVTATVHGSIGTLLVKHLPGTHDLVSPTAAVTLRIVTS